MKLNNKIFLIKRRILKNNNITLIIILSLIFVGIYSCITIMNMSSELRRTSLEHQSGRTLLISNIKDENDVIKIKSINHVENITSQKNLYGTVVPAKLDGLPKSGLIEINPIISTKNIKMIKGTMPKKSGEMICPTNFIFLDNDIVEENFNYKDYLLSDKEILNRRITLKNDDNGIEEYEFKIVGIFKDIPKDTLGSCYISIEDFDKLKSDIEYCSDDECYEYSSEIVIVDDYENIEYVEKKLNDIGYASMRILTIDEEKLTSLTYIPMFICTIIIIISITIIYNFYNTKTYNERKRYGILKSIGYNNKQIIDISVLEEIIIYIISIILSFIIYVIGYKIIVNKYLYEYIYENFIIPIPYMYLIIFILLTAVYVIIIVKYIIKKRINTCAENLFNGVKK